MWFDWRIREKRSVALLGAIGGVILCLGASGGGVLTDFRFAQKENLFRVEIHASRAIKKRFIYENKIKAGRIQFDFSGFEAEERVYELNNEILKQVKVYFIKGPEKVVRCQFDIVHGVSLAWVEPRGKVLTIAFERRDSAAASETPLPPDAEADSWMVKPHDEILQLFLAATPSEYRLDEGDVISISVYMHEDLSLQLNVPPEGYVNYPLLGEVQLIGRTAAEIEQHMREALARDYLINPQVKVIVAQYASQWVFVGGEVQRPGKFFFHSPTTLIEALIEAGGLQEGLIGEPEQAGAARSVYLSRRIGEETVVLQVPVKELFGVLNSPYQEIYVFSGDIIEAPKTSLYFYISGEVGKPGVYEYKEHLTVHRAILEAGGLGQWGSARNLQLIRTAPDGERKKYRINLNRIKKGKSKDVPLQPEDLIVVKRRMI
jgi:polysaccharide export outer membrane protein